MAEEAAEQSDEAIERAVEALEDDEVRQRVAAGDFSDLDGLGLPDEATEQLQTMANEWDEVEGFAFAPWQNPDGTPKQKGASLIFSRTVYGDMITFKRGINRGLDRTASVQPLGGLSSGGADI